MQNEIVQVLQQGQYRVLIDNTPHPVLILDVSSGRFIEFNEKAELFLNLSGASLHKLGLIDLIHQSRIFSIFQRLHPSSEYPGMGIGLSHCQKIVELHGGQIWVESRPKEGSRFYFNVGLSGTNGESNKSPVN